VSTPAHSYLALWTGEAGDAASARDQFIALLSIRGRVLGAEHRDTLTALDRHHEGMALGTLGLAPRAHGADRLAVPCGRCAGSTRRSPHTKKPPPSSGRPTTGTARQADPALIREAFRWWVTWRVTRVATVPLEGNSYSVDPALTGR